MRFGKPVARLLASLIVGWTSAVAFVSTAHAYPPTSTAVWGCGPAVNNVCGCGGGMPGGGISHATGDAACADPLWYSSGNTGLRNTFDFRSGNLCYWRFANEAPGQGQATHTVCQGPVQDTCPNGGTLTAGQCVCGAGETDTGTACTTPSCPAGQHLVNGVCVSICPGAGRAWNPLDSGDPSVADLTYPSGQKTVCADVAFQAQSGPVSDKCVVVPTGSLIVCADIGGGSGVVCGSESGRYTGARCSVATDMPADPDPTVCSAGELWCESTGACASGFVQGVFNGRAICTKIGEVVNVVPRVKSPTSPPRPEDMTNPTPHSDPPTQTGEAPEVFDSVVVGVGPGATQGGSGAGAGTGEDMVSCGLPDTPKCKIDETGTPTTLPEGMTTERTSLIAKITELTEAKTNAVASPPTAVGGSGLGSVASFAGSDSCQSFDLVFVDFDPCPHASTSRMVFGFFWSLLLLAYLWRRSNDVLQHGAK